MSDITSALMILGFITLWGAYSFCFWIDCCKRTEEPSSPSDSSTTEASDWTNVENA